MNLELIRDIDIRINW